MSAEVTMGRSTIRRRAGRTVRAVSPARSRLTERDAWILDALARMRYLTTAQLGRLLFAGSRSATNKRLRKVLDAGLVRVWVVQLHADNIYALSPLGRRVLEERGYDVDTIRCPRQLDRQLGHLLTINSVRIALALDLARADGELVWWRSEWDLRASHRARTIPDALCAIRWLDFGERVFAIEIEHRTRSPRSFLGKLLRYRAAAYAGNNVYGTRPDAVLVIAHDPTWLARYLPTLAAHRLAVNVCFTTLDELERDAARRPIWRSLYGHNLSLRTLATLPSGTEWPAEKTAAATTPSVSAAPHKYPL